MYPIRDIKERIIYNENGLVVVNKPYDIPTSGKNLEDKDALQFWLEKEIGTRAWAVHQLDADTSGINLFVTQKKLVKFYKDLLSNEKSVKRYVAIVHGIPMWDTTVCTEKIGLIDNRSLGVNNEIGKSAYSSFSVIDTAQNYSLIEANITTGRTHQIRIHLSYLGYPLVGEDWYSNKKREHFRQALHLYSLSLPNGEKYCIDVSEDLRKLSQRLHLDMSIIGN